MERAVHINKVPSFSDDAGEKETEEVSMVWRNAN